MAWVCQRATSNLLGVLSSGTPPIPIPDAVNIPCSCQNPHTVLNVTCVYMDHLEEIKVQHCLKHPAAIQLLKLGLFPCMPVRPGLAVSLVMLEWVCTLFLHMVLNVQDCCLDGRCWVSSQVEIMAPTMLNAEMLNLDSMLWGGPGVFKCPEKARDDGHEEHRLL